MMSGNKGMERCEKTDEGLKCEVKRAGGICKFVIAPNAKGQMEPTRTEGDIKCLQEAIPEKMKQSRVSSPEENTDW